MNKRIKELIEQSTTIEYGVDNGFDRTTFDKEKFAESIIQECMSLCEEQRARYFGYRIAASDFVDKNMWAQAEATCDTLRHRMVKQFGVKE